VKFALHALFWCDYGAKTQYLAAKPARQQNNAVENAVKIRLNVANFVENQFFLLILDRV